MESSYVVEKSWRTLRIRKMQPKFDLKIFFDLVLMSTGTGLGHKENTHSEIILLGRLKKFDCILFSYGSDIRCHLTWLKH